MNANLRQPPNRNTRGSSCPILRDSYDTITSAHDSAPYSKGWKLWKVVEISIGVPLGARLHHRLSLPL